MKKYWNYESESSNCQMARIFYEPCLRISQIISRQGHFGLERILGISRPDFFSMKAKWCTNRSCQNGSRGDRRKKYFLKCDIEIQYRFNQETREGEIKIGKKIHQNRKCNKCDMVNVFYF